MGTSDEETPREAAPAGSPNGKGDPTPPSAQSAAGPSKAPAPSSPAVPSAAKGASGPIPLPHPTGPAVWSEPKAPPEEPASLPSSSRRLIIVSNRLPYSVERGPDGAPRLVRSSGGLVSGLAPLHEKPGNLWIGWDGEAAPAGTPAGTPSEAAADAVPAPSPDVGAGHEDVDRLFAEHGCIPISLSAEEVEGYYEGYSNSTIWPLFHGFSQYAEFDNASWESYCRVNERFCEAVASVARPGDVIWVHDYQLMLLPKLLRERLPQASIGFFLHIPFPDFEAFRMLPQRREILEGMLGADLIGFHAYDYVHHFLSSCQHLLGQSNRQGYFLIDDRIVQADAFPLGIDYERFRRAVAEPETSEAIEWIRASKRPGTKTMLSVERLDYTKGIAQRLRAFETLLERCPEWRGKATLLLVVVPSREDVETYRQLKSEVDELVGSINGRFATAEWTPIEYFYRSVPFPLLCALYATSDVMLVTPLRDGMNLVCKEYLACRTDGSGVIVLSEMAGAAYELHEAIIVNPFDQEALVEAMRQALEMPQDEQRRRIGALQERVSRYTSSKWAEEFLRALGGIARKQDELNARLVSPRVAAQIADTFRGAKERLLILDYDGTLVPFFQEPQQAAPDEALKRLLRRLAACPGTTVAIVSGRDRQTLGAWFSDLPIDLAAEHGLWRYDRTSGQWLLREPLRNEWKDRVRPVLADFVDRTPGSLLEEKDYALAWHYRGCERELAERRVIEIKDALEPLMENYGLSFLDGNRVLEVRPATIDKGVAAHHWLRRDHDFVLVAGDDATDEDMFRAAPKDAWTIKVRNEPTLARWSVRSPFELRTLLGLLSQAGGLQAGGLHRYP